MNQFIKVHNEKVEQLHELLEWFANEYKGLPELSDVTQKAQDVSTQIQKLIEK